MFIQLKQAHFGKPAGERLDVDEKSAQALVAAGIAEAVPGNPISEAIAKGMSEQMETMGKSITDLLNAALKRFQDAQAQASKHAVPAIFGAGGQGDPKKNFGDWALAVARGDRKYLEAHYGSKFNEWQAKAAMGEASGVTGGYTVPTEFYQQLITIMAEQTFIRPRAFVLPMSSATLLMPYLDVTTVQAAGTPPFFGGVKMSWTAESQTRKETEPQFKQLELKAWELSGYSVSSNVLLQDSVVGLEKFLMVLFAQAIAWFEEYAFLQGSGVGSPQGMLGCSAAIATGGNAGATARAAANSVGFADVATMWSKLLPVSWNKAIWTCSPSVVPQLLQLKDGAGRAIFLQIGSNTQGAITSAPVWSLLGRPIFPTEKVPALGTKGDLMLLDPSFYVIGDRMSIEVAASEHVNFLANQMTWRVVERVDGEPWLDAPVTLQDAATKVSPFVVLN